MIVIGLTGTIGSGKNIVAEILKSRFDSWYVSLSSVIRAEIEKKRRVLSRTSLQDHGDELRKKYGGHILAKLAVEYLQRNKKVIIIDGIRNPGEIEWLKNRFGNDFILIAIDAPREMRYERTIKRNRENDPKSWEEFLEADERDLGTNQPEHGQHTRACLDKADFFIDNSGTEEELRKKVNEIIENIKNSKQ